jgi:hypothetical protein
VTISWPVLSVPRCNARWVYATQTKWMHTPVMGRTSRRGVRDGDLPLRLSIAQAGKRTFHYLILRNDGTVIEASSTSYETENGARVAGLPVLQRISDVGKSNRVKRQSSRP